MACVACDRRQFYLNFSVQVSGGRRRSSGIPRSRGSSREASPNRYGMRSYNLRASAERTIPKPPPASRPHLTENILKQSREAENALADALVSCCPPPVCTTRNTKTRAFCTFFYNLQICIPAGSMFRDSGIAL